MLRSVVQRNSSKTFRASELVVKPATEAAQRRARRLAPPPLHRHSDRMHAADTHAHIRRTRAIVATLLATTFTTLASPPAAAQTLYRCGKTFSQTPCAADAESLKLRDGGEGRGGGSGGNTAAQTEAATGAQTCANAARAHLNVPARHTLEIDRAQAGKHDPLSLTARIHRQPLPTRRRC